MKLRLARSEIDLYISKLTKSGDVKVSDKVSGNLRIVETKKVRITSTGNGWVDITQIG